MTDAAVRMDRQYRWQRHIYDLTRKPYLLGRDRLVAELLPTPGARVLEIGCGTGRNLIRIARTYPRVGWKPRAARLRAPALQAASGSPRRMPRQSIRRGSSAARPSSGS